MGSNLLSGWVDSMSLKCDRKIKWERRKEFENTDRKTEAHLKGSCSGLIKTCSSFLIISEKLYLLACYFPKPNSTWKNPQWQWMLFSETAVEVKGQLHQPLVSPHDRVRLLPRYLSAVFAGTLKWVLSIVAISKTLIDHGLSSSAMLTPYLMVCLVLSHQCKLYTQGPQLQQDFKAMCSF